MTFIERIPPPQSHDQDWMRGFYPDAYTPRRVTQWQLLKEWGASLFTDCVRHWWFWSLVIAAATWLSYLFVDWALNVPGAMRIHQ